MFGCFNTPLVHRWFQLSISESIREHNCDTLPNPRQQQWPALSPSSCPIMIECSSLKEASVIAVMNDKAGGDTTVDVSSINLPQHSSCPC